MKIIKAGFEIMDPLNGEKILRKIERVARVCYKSEDKITTGSAEKMVRGLIKRGHEAMLEHFSFCEVKATVSIGFCVFIGIISFIVGSFSGICMICMCVVGGSGDESGADSNIEEEHKPEA